MSAAYAWIRRTGKYDGSDLATPEQAAAVRRAIERWPQYAEFRRKLAAAAQANEPLPIWNGEELPPDAWLCPIDDDDWHSPEVATICREAPPDIDYIWWNIASIRWVRPTLIDPLWRHEGRLLPGTCGYAIRARALPDRDSQDFAFLRDDHIYSLAHAVRLGARVMHVPKVGGIWNVTPGSVSILVEFDGAPPRPSADEIAAITQAALPEWIRKGAEATAGLIRLFC